MSYKTEPAQTYQKLTTFTSDIPGPWRAVEPVGGAQFVYIDNTNTERTVLAADYATFTKHPSHVKTIKSTTDCTAVHVWG